MAATEVGTAYVSLIPSAKGFGAATAKELNPQLAAAGKKGGTALGDGIGSGLQSAGKRIAGVGDKLTLGVTAPLAAVGVAAFGAASEYQRAMGMIRVGTGATGDALEDLGGNFEAVNRRVPDATETVATAIADLNTRTGATGPALEELAEQSVNLARITGGEVGPTIEATTRVFGDWGIATKDQSDTLDLLFRASQTTGIGVDQLSSQLVQFGAPMRQLGFSLEESAALLGQFEQEGVNAELVMGSMRIALGKMARDGEPAVETFARVTDEIANAGSASEANALALELFGARAGPDMAASIREGRFEVDELVASLADGPETINDAAGDSLTSAERMQMSIKRIQEALVPVGEAIADAMEAVLPTINKLADWFGRLDPSTKRTALGFLAVVAAIGPVLSIGGRVVSVIGTMIKVGQGLVVVIRAIGLAMAANPLGLILTAIGLLVAGLILAYQKSETFRNIVDTALRAVGAAASWVWENALKPLWGGIKFGIDIAVAAAQMWWKVYGPIFRAVGAVALWLWNNIIQPVFVKGFQTAFRLVAAAAKTWWRGVQIVWRAVAAGVKWLWDRVKLGFSRAKEIFFQVVDWVRTMWQRAKDRFNALVQFARKLPGRIKAGLSNLKNRLLAPFRAAFNAVAGLWNSTLGNISFSVPDWVPGVGGKGWSFPSIPTAARGGVFDPRAGGTLALLAEAGVREYALPEPDLDRLLRAAVSSAAPAGAAAPAQVDVTVLLDGRAIEPRMAKVLKTHDRDLKRRVDAGAGALA